MKMRPYQDAAITGAFEAWKEAAMDFEARGCGLCSTTEKGERQ